jgi:hypothetical protein
MARTVLVLGATGILAPAASVLSAHGHVVVGVSRGGGAGTIGVDATDAAALAAVLVGISWDDAVVYARTVSADSLAWVRASTPGRCVVVRGSAAADPALGALVVPSDTLQLGWTIEEPHRWHTPAAVSDAALEVLADGGPGMLGTVRPWSDRP